MVFAHQSSTSAKDMTHLHLALRPSRMDFSTRNSVHLPDSSKSTTCNLFTDVSNITHCLPTTASGTSVDELSLPSPRSHPTIQLSRVVTMDRHDMDAWTQGREMHDTGLSAVPVSSSLSSNGAILDDYFMVDVAKSGSTPTEPQTKRHQTLDKLPSAGQLRSPHSWIPPFAPGSGVLSIRPNITVGSQELSEGSHQVGEILAHCGAINVFGMSPTESTAVGWGRNSGAHFVDAPGVTAELLFSENNGLLITALADWISEWVHTLVIRPYLQGNFRFQYQLKPNGPSASVGSRIRRVLGNMENPMQVAIHALWFISTLTGNGAQNNAPFLSIPIFRYLHNNGTFVAEEFMFRTFVTCAMIGDKTVNDITLSTKTWNRLTRIPQIILSATEKYALSCLEWNVVMTRNQWQDTIIYLRSCIKMGSAFDPFAYDGISPSNIMARYLDKLIELSHAEETNTYRQEISAEILAPQPIRHFTHWEVFNTAEWRPENDPVINQKPRTIGIAPGAERNSNTLKVGTTAKDLLDSILGSSNVSDLSHLAQPAGTSLPGSIGVIGARLAHTIRIARCTCQGTSWLPSHG